MFERDTLTLSGLHHRQKKKENTVQASDHAPPALRNKHNSRPSSAIVWHTSTSVSPLGTVSEEGNEHNHALSLGSSTSEERPSLPTTLKSVSDHNTGQKAHDYW